MSIINDSNKLGSGGQNLVLETAGKVYVKVKDRFYELDFRNQGKGGTTVINNTVQEDVPETDLSEYVTKDDLDASLRNYVTKRSWNDVKETQEMLEQALLDGFTERINPISIDTMQLIVGSKQLQFEFIESLIDGTPKSHGIYIDEIGRLVCPEGIIQHYTIDGPDAVQPEKALKQYCRWTVKSNSNTDPDNKDAYFDLPVDDQAYYLYIVADKINFTQEAIDLPDDEASKTGIYAKTGEATFLISETAYGLHAEGDNSKYYFLYAIVNSKSDGVRSISTLNGFTEILPGQITAYVFKNPTGTSYIDLLGNKMNFGGKLTYNVDHPDALVIHGAIIQDDGGNESLITVDRGVYSNDNCYYGGDLVQWTDADDNKSTYYHFVDSETCGIDPSDETVWRIYAQGSTGDTMFKSVVFKRTNSTPATPEGGSFDSPLPEPRNGWEDGVPEGEAQLWMSTRVFSKSGKRDGNWTTPQPATDTADLDFEYSSNALDNKPINPDDDTTGAWHDHAVPEDNWMAMRKINNGEPVLIPVSTKGWEINQIKGESGKDAKLLYLSASSLVFTYDTKESTSPRESSIVFTCKTQNVTSTSYSWSYKKQGSSSYTRITGVSGSTFTLNASSISTYFGSGQYCTFKVEIDGLSDEIAIALIYGGTDAITTFLTNTSHVFEGDEDSAIAGTDHINVLVYKGIELLSSNKYTLGTITGQQTGLTTSTTTATESGVTVRSITITVTTSLTKSGVLTIPVNVEGSTIDLKYSWSISFKGKPGESKQGATARVREWVLGETYYNGEIADDSGRFWMDFVYYDGNYYRCNSPSIRPTSGTPTDNGFILESKYSFIASKVFFAGDKGRGWVIDAGEIYHTGQLAKLTSEGGIYLGNTDPSEEPTKDTANFAVNPDGTVDIKGNVTLQGDNRLQLIGEDVGSGAPLSCSISNSIVSYNTYTEHYILTPYSFPHIGLSVSGDYDPSGGGSWSGHHYDSYSSSRVQIYRMTLHAGDRIKVVSTISPENYGNVSAGSNCTADFYAYITGTMTGPSGTTIREDRYHELEAIEDGTHYIYAQFSASLSLNEYNVDYTARGSWSESCIGKVTNIVYKERTNTTGTLIGNNGLISILKGGIYLKCATDENENNPSIILCKEVNENTKYYLRVDDTGVWCKNGNNPEFLITAGGGGGGSTSVSWAGDYSSSTGTKMGTLKVNETPYILYAPKGGSGNVTGSSLTADAIVVGSGDSAIKSASKYLTTSWQSASNTYFPSCKAIETYVSEHGGGGGNVTGSGLTSNTLIVGDGNSDIKTSSKYLTTSWQSSSDSYIPTCKAIETYVSEHGGGGSTFDGGEIKNDLWLHTGSATYGSKLWFGDKGTSSGYAYIHEDADDHLHMRGNNGISLSTGSGYGVTIGTGTKTGAQSYRLNVDGTAYATEYVDSSDERLKDIISNLNVSLSDINEIPKVIFSWKDDPEKKEHIGTIAQALLNKFPQLVTQDDKGYYAVNYDALSVVALHGIDKLYEENIMLRARVSQLDERLRILEEKVNGSTGNK